MYLPLFHLFLSSNLQPNLQFFWLIEFPWLYSFQLEVLPIFSKILILKKSLPFLYLAVPLLELFFSAKKCEYKVMKLYLPLFPLVFLPPPFLLSLLFLFHLLFLSSQFPLFSINFFLVFFFPMKINFKKSSYHFNVLQNNFFRIISLQLQV